MRVQRVKIEAEDEAGTFGTPRDPRATSRKLQRLRFLQEPQHVRLKTRARVQLIVNAEIARRQKVPSQLAQALANGMYDEPKPGELAALEEWATLL